MGDVHEIMFDVGVEVLIDGLSSSTDLNGKRGKVVGLPHGERIPVVVNG